MDFPAILVYLLLLYPPYDDDTEHFSSNSTGKEMNADVCVVALNKAQV